MDWTNFIGPVVAGLTTLIGGYWLGTLGKWRKK